MTEIEQSFLSKYTQCPDMRGRTITHVYRDQYICILIFDDNTYAKFVAVRYCEEADLECHSLTLLDLKNLGLATLEQWFDHEKQLKQQEEDRQLASRKITIDSSLRNLGLEKLKELAHRESPVLIFCNRKWLEVEHDEIERVIRKLDQ